MADPKGNGNIVPIIVAIIGAVGTIVSAYIATEKSNQNTSLKGEVIDYKQELAKMSERYDSLKSAYNHLAQAQRNNSNTIDKPERVINSIEDSLPKEVQLDNSRFGNHFIQLKSVQGDKKNQFVTVKFLVTNEQNSSFEQLWMAESIGKFEGKTFYAIRAMLGDKRGEGIGGWTYPQMQMVKNEPTEASMVWSDVPLSVDQFSTLIINANGDHVPFKNVPITWN